MSAPQPAVLGSAKEAASLLGEKKVMEPRSVLRASLKDPMADAKVPIETNPSWERVLLARHSKRPHALDYIQRLFTNFEELHGDRA
jgi:acetyl-CoA carboxylase alpha subunit